MEMHKKVKNQTGVNQAKSQGEECTYQPKRAKPVPNFAKQHEIFQKTLEKHKKQKRATEPKPFEFRETKVIKKNNTV